MQEVSGCGEKSKEPAEESTYGESESPTPGKGDDHPRVNVQEVNGRGALWRKQKAPLPMVSSLMRTLNSWGSSLPMSSRTCRNKGENSPAREPVSELTPWPLKVLLLDRLQPCTMLMLQSSRTSTVEVGSTDGAFQRTPG